MFKQNVAEMLDRVKTDKLEKSTDVCTDEKWINAWNHMLKITDAVVGDA